MVPCGVVRCGVRLIRTTPRTIRTIPIQRAAETCSCKKQVCEQRNQRVSDRGKRHHKTVVGPGEHEHVAHHEHQHHGDSEPNRSACQHARRSRRQGGKMRNVQVPCVLHSFAQNRVSHRPEHDEQEKQDVRFGFVSLCRCHRGSKALWRRPLAGGCSHLRKCRPPARRRRHKIQFSPRRLKQAPRQSGPFRAPWLCARAGT